MSLIPCSSVLPDSHIQSLVPWRLVHIFSSIIGDVLTGIFRLVRVGDSLHQRSKGVAGGSLTDYLPKLPSAIRLRAKCSYNRSLGDLRLAAFRCILSRQ